MNTRTGPLMGCIITALDIAGYEGASLEAIFREVGWNRMRRDVRLSLQVLVKQGRVEVDDSGNRFRLIEKDFRRDQTQPVCALLRRQAE